MAKVHSERSPASFAASSQQAGPSLRPLVSLPHAAATAVFSRDATRLAVGADDGHVAVLDASALPVAYADAFQAARVYKDHLSRVNALDFHPQASTPVLVSGSEDATLRFYDLSSAAPSALRQCSDTHAVSSVEFHPLGGHMLVGTSHPAVHLYDVATFKCYLSASPLDHHTAPVTGVRWAPSGKAYASCGGDAVKLWDGVSGRCVKTLGAAHLGAPVYSLLFTPSGEQLLTCGGDSCVRLWDVGTGQQVRAYEGAQQTMRTNCAFSADGKFVLCSDEATGEVVAWDVATADEVARVAAHGGAVRWLAVSTAGVVVSLGSDGSLRAWH